MNYGCDTIGVRATGIEPVWTGSGSATLEFRSGEFQTRCVYQFHHTRVDRQMGVSGPDDEGILTRYMPSSSGFFTDYRTSPQYLTSYTSPS